MTRVYGDGGSEKKVRSYRGSMMEAPSVQFVGWRFRRTRRGSLPLGGGLAGLFSRRVGPRVRCCSLLLYLDSCSFLSPAAADGIGDGGGLWGGKSGSSGGYGENTRWKVYFLRRGASQYELGEWAIDELCEVVRFGE